MHASVLAKWHQFSLPLEGYVDCMYVDVKNLVTTAVGILIDPVGAALRLPWKLPDGTLANDAQIREQWLTLKHHPGLPLKPGGPLVPLPKLHWKTAAKLTTLRLTDADIDALVVGKLLDNERYLRKAFPGWDAWPADAQLGALSMAWAVGPGFPKIFSNFTRYANEGDWLAAKVSCKIKATNNPGLVPRNRHNELCFDNAATVLGRNLDVSELHWPGKAPLLDREPDATPTEPLLQVGITDADRARVAAMQAEYARQVTSDVHEQAMRDLSSTDDEGGL